LSRPKHHKLQSFALLPLYKQLVPDELRLQALQIHLLSAHDKLIFNLAATCLQE